FKVATNVVVTTDAYGTNEVLHQCCSELFFADFFLFFATQPRPVPTVTSVTPSSAWAATGQLTVEIKGTGFRYIDEQGIDQPNVNWVTFGGFSATNFAISDSETIICNVPAGALGTVDVRVWNFVGVSAVTAADRFTYAPANGLFLTQLALPRTIPSKTAPPCFPAGNYISYSLIISNPMQANAESVVLTDILPAETTVVSCNFIGGSCGGSGNNLTLTFPPIPYGVSMGV